jgi:hypothetical protein
MHWSWADGRFQPTGKRNPADGEQPNNQPARHGLLDQIFPACRHIAFEEQQEYGSKY